MTNESRVEKDPKHKTPEKQPRNSEPLILVSVPLSQREGEQLVKRECKAVDLYPFHWWRKIIAASGNIELGVNFNIGTRPQDTSYTLRLHVSARVHKAMQAVTRHLTAI